MSQYVENIIQEKMDKINSKGNVYEVGRVIGVTDYIVEVSGLIQVSFKMCIRDRHMDDSIHDCLLWKAGQSEDNRQIW